MATYVVDPGGTGDYLSLAACITGLAGDRAGEAIVIQFHSSDGSADTSQVIISGITNYSSFLIEPHASHNRPGAKWDANEYRLTVSVQFGAVVYPQIDNVVIDGLQIEQTSSLSPARGILLTLIPSTVTVKNCYVRYTNASQATDGAGIHYRDDVGTYHIVNNTIEGFYEGIFAAGIGAGSEINAYNNTIIDCVGYGGYFSGAPVSAATLNVKNNIIAGSGTQDYFTDTGINVTLSEVTNSTSDTSSPTVGLQSITPTFVDSANGDYHLVIGDTSFIGAATDLSADAFFPFNADSDLDVRSSWDLGADEIGALSVDFIPSGNVPYEPTLIVNQTLSADFISTGYSIYEPGVVNFGTIDVDFISTGNALYEPTLTQSEVANSWFNQSWWRSPYWGTGWWGTRAVITDQTIASTASLYEPTLTPGAVSISVDFISTGYSIYEPTLSVENVVQAPFISSTETLYEPSLTVVLDQTITVDYLNNPSVLFVPAVKKETIIDGVDSLVISTNYQSKTLYCSPSNGWFTI